MAGAFSGGSWTIFGENLWQVLLVVALGQSLERTNRHTSHKLLLLTLMM